MESWLHWRQLRVGLRGRRRPSLRGYGGNVRDPEGEVHAGEAARGIASTGAGRRDCLTHGLCLFLLQLVPRPKLHK